MRVLIIGPPDSRGALAAVRALGPAGWEVGYGTPERDNLVTRSRWLDRWFALPWPQQGLPAFQAALDKAVYLGRYEAVFAAGDDWLVGLDAARDRLAARVPYAPSASLRAGLDKLELARLADQAGLRAPLTVEATDEALRRWKGPAVVKPRDHWLPGPADPPQHLMAEVVPDNAAAARRVAQIRAAGAAALLQERLSGPLLALTTLADDGARPVARLQQVVERTWPSPAGISVRARTVPVDPNLAAGADALLQRLDWFGMAQLQFVVTESGPVLIDLNPRFYGSLALALEAGLNLPLLWARMATGRPVPERGDARIGARYSWLEGDLRRARAERRGGLFPDMASSLRWSWGAGHSITSLRDPVPAARWSTVLLQRAARNAVARSSR